MQQNDNEQIARIEREIAAANHAIEKQRIEIAEAERRISAAKEFLANHQTQIGRETASAYAKSIAEWQIVGLATVQITEWMPLCDVLIDVEKVVHLTLNDTNRTTNH